MQALKLKNFCYLIFQITFQTVVATDGLLSFATSIYDATAESAVRDVDNSVGFDAGEGRQISATNIADDPYRSSFVSHRIDGNSLTL